MTELNSLSGKYTFQNHSLFSSTTFGFVASFMDTFTLFSTPLLVTGGCSLLALALSLPFSAKGRCNTSANFFLVFSLAK
ncbi:MULTISPECIES: hypothetical protein [Listeria]|uniref:hypothetical protein n=1 Tax=Listeria TaxID=1637 RepID=UPI0016256EA0|nr:MULTISPECIES: hypothetical protein [Listeria]